MAELTEEERANLPDSVFADPEHRAYPIHDEEHARAALSRVKQHGTKDEQKKVARKVHERYPNIQLGQYFMALLGLVLVTALVGTWIRDTQGHYRFKKFPDKSPYQNKQITTGGYQRHISRNCKYATESDCTAKHSADEIASCAASTTARN